jgi:hypothetical protein
MIITVDKSSKDDHTIFQRYGWAPHKQHATIAANFVCGDCYLRGWNIGLRITTWRALCLFGGKWHRSIVLTSSCSSPWAIVQSFFSSMHPCSIISYALHGLC